jgi:predicted ATPase/DNA-binding CsgD family transcriptional regulator/Tfp pilus assembly protein PilF
MIERIHSQRSDNLPTHLSIFIGREREIASLKHLLLGNRLVTLTGVGGSGKTRLSIKLANELLNKFEQGIWFIRFASLSDHELVPQAVASTLGVREQKKQTIVDGLIEHLKNQRSLLIFDNCEHLIDACAKLAKEILQACPNIKILATSREPLNIPGEVVWTVPPLSLPERQPWHDPKTGETALSIYRQSESVQLFLNRAALVLPDFELSIDNGAWVAEICRRLDGMPLAIEFAAARVRALSVQQIAERLDDRFNLLTGGSRTAHARHQTLAATLDWSYALLSEKEKRVLQRFSVFSDGATLDAVESVCTGDDVEAAQALEVLSQLIDKSLITADRFEHGKTRYFLLETIREYARERLIESGEQANIHRRHLEFFLQLAREAEPNLKGPEQGNWLRRLQLEQDNFRSALTWSLENDRTMALQLAVALGQFWFMRGYQFGEGMKWLKSILSRSDNTQNKRLHADAYSRLGTLAYFHNDYVTARSAYENSLKFYREENDKYAVLEVLYFLAELSLFQSDEASKSSPYNTARLSAEECLVSLREQGDRWKTAQVLNMLGEMLRVDGDYDTARSYYEESLAIRRELNDERGVAVSLINLGYVAYHKGAYREAKKFFEESLTMFQGIESTRGTIDCLDGLAGVLGAEHKPEHAARLFGAAEQLRETARIGLTVAFSDQMEYDRYKAFVRSQLTEDAFAAAWTDGRKMTLEQAIEFALQPSESSKTSNSLKEKFGGLSPRERETAMLIAQGKSNREIAMEMVVGVKTVETYVSRILNKLDFDSRVQIATWAVEVDLASAIKDN